MRVSLDGSCYESDYILADVGSGRPAKRQRTDGMNSRFDRMIQTVNILHATPNSGTRSRRQRAASSSSAATYDAPRTPVDAYNAFDGGALGENFSVLKMDGPGSSVRDHDPFDRSAFCDWDEDSPRATDATRCLPPWLQGTITTLGSKHPLRLLLPTSDSGGPIPDGSSDSASQMAVETSPFAFVPPAEPELPVALERLRRNIAPLEPTLDYVHGPYVIPEVPPVWLASPEAQSPSPRPSPTTELPFSTAGPASCLSSFVDSASAAAPRVTHALNTIAMYADSYTAPMPVPFSTPGPACLTGGFARPVVLEPNFAPISATSVLRSRLSLQSPPPALSPWLAVQPFCTPGPMTMSTVPTHVDFRQSSSNPTILLSCTQDRFPEPSHPSRHAQRITSPSRTTSTAPSSTSRSVECFMPDLAECHTPDFGTPLENDEPGTPHPQPVDYETLGFKWEKFDRGDIVLDAPSSPAPPADSYSEEVFWSQPRAPEPHTPIRTDSFDPSEAALESSPASLGLSGISTPDMQSPQVQRHADAHMHTPSGRYHATHDSQQSGNVSPFAWIVTPRDMAAAPSTSRYTAKAKLGDRDPWAEDARRHILDFGSQDGQQNRSHDDGVEVEEPEPHVGTPPAPFAPAPGIYISPLRGATDVDGEGEGGAEGLGFPPKDRVAQVSTHA